MTPTESILKFCDEWDSKRNGTSFVPKEDWSFEDSETVLECPACGEEVESPGFTIMSNDAYKAAHIHLFGLESICKPQAEFIAHAANNSSRAIEALRFLVQEIRYETFCNCQEEKLLERRWCWGCKALAKAAKILEGS